MPDLDFVPDWSADEEDERTGGVTPVPESPELSASADPTGGATTEPSEPPSGDTAPPSGGEGPVPEPSGGVTPIPLQARSKARPRRHPCTKFRIATFGVQKLAQRLRNENQAANDIYEAWWPTRGGAPQTIDKELITNALGEYVG